MERQELRRWLLDNAFQKCGNRVNVHAIKRNKDILDALYDYTDFLKEVPFARRVFAVLNAESDLPVCVVCGDKVVQRKHKAKPKIMCSTSCATKCPQTQKKIVETSRRLYGEDNPSSSDLVKLKTGATNLARYGKEYIFQVDEFKAKSIQTSIDKYGVDHPAKSDLVKSKMRATCRALYGYENTYSSPIIQDRIRRTCIERYGDEYPTRTDKIKQKIRQTCQARYGVDNTDYRHISDDTLAILHDASKLEQLYNSHGSIILSGLLGIHRTTICRYLKNHGIPIDNTAISKDEKGLSNYMSSLDINIIVNSRNIIPPYELDIYSSEHNLAIEYNGVYWHTESKGKSKDYHLNKTLLCAEKNIQLLHIFSSDDLDIWKCFIENKLGRSQAIYARQTLVVPIDNATARSFCEHNHLQGGVNSKYNYGLFYEGVLVSVMTFTKARFSRADYELLRFCTLRGYRVIGGAGKLLKYFRKDHQGSIISYANLRWSNGKLYDSLGFKFLHISSPNYFYTKDYITLYSRNKLSKLLDYFDPALSEWENMQNNGLDRIWDCGNLVYLLER